MATTFAAGQTINLSLDGNDTITWVGSGNMTVTPASGPSWAVHLEGSQTYGPFGQAVSVSIVTVTNGSYTVNGGSFPVVANEYPLTGWIEFSAGGTAVNIGDFILSTFPVGIAPNGTIADNGVLTLGTALNVIYSDGIYLHFPAGAVYSGSIAGAYYCVMSSTTAGVVYDNMLSGIPGYVASPTPVVATGPGAYTAPTGTNIVLITAPNIPANAFGLNGGFQATIIGSNNNSAGGKTTRMQINGANIGGATTSTSTNNSQTIVFQNVGKADKNIVFFQNFGASAYGQARSNTTVNTAADVALTVLGNLVVATDWVIVDTVIGRKLGNA